MPFQNHQLVMICYSTRRKLLRVSSSVTSNSATPWTVAHQAPLSMEFSMQEYWSGLPFPSPGDLPNPGIEPRSPALQADSLLTEPMVVLKVWSDIFRYIFFPKAVFLRLILKLA